MRYLNIQYLINRLTDCYYDTKNGIRGILYWSSFGWKWRSWDYAYGLMALRHHLIKLEPCVRNGYAADAKKTANEIKKAIKLLDRIIDQDYLKLQGKPNLKIKANITRSAVVKAALLEEKEWKEFNDLIYAKMRSWWD